MREVDGRRIFDIMRWGVPVPARNAKDQSIEKPVTNVRNLASPFLRSMLSNSASRCLMPVTDFCEWSGENAA